MAKEDGKIVGEENKRQITPLEEVIGDFNAFLNSGLQNLKEIDLDVSAFAIDHIAYRVADLEMFQAKKEALMKLSKAWVESIFHERPIAKFQLMEPIEIEGHTINLIELPAPKPGSAYKNGLEHFEVVTGDKLDFIRSQLEKLRSNSTLLIDTSNEPRSHNETLSVKFEDGISVKFHREPLLKIMEMEGQKLIPLF